MQTAKAVGVLVAALLSSGLLVLAVCGPASAPPAEVSKPSAQPMLRQPSTTPGARTEPSTAPPVAHLQATLPAFPDPAFLRLLERELYDPDGYPRAWLAPDERQENP
jgi:hypothetical protein